MTMTTHVRHQLIGLAILTSVLGRGAVLGHEARSADGGAQPTPDEHPLRSALRIAYDVRAHIAKTVQDYSCVLIRRERVDGRLMGYRYMDVKIRHEQIRDGHVVTPFSVYLRFLSPAKLRDREVLYVKGWNDGKLIARKGGPRFSYVTVSLDPLNESAMKGNRYPVTEIGIQNLVERLIEVGEEEIKLDPASEPCQVKFYAEAKVCGRVCSSIHVSYPENGEHHRFHLVRIYIDKELYVPIRYEAYDFPEVEGGEPRLLEEYTYRDLKLNIGLTDDDFQRGRFGAPGL